MRKDRNRRSLFWVILCLSLAVLSGCGSKREPELVKNGVLKVGMNLHINGMCYLSEEKNKPEGFEVELAQKLADQMELSLEIVDTTEENLLKSLDGEVYDCVLSAVGISDWNTRQYSHTEPYGDISSVKEETGVDTPYTEIAAFTKKFNPLSEELDEQIGQLKKSGFLKELSEKYFQKDITK